MNSNALSAVFIVCATVIILALIASFSGWFG